MENIQTKFDFEFDNLCLKIKENKNVKKILIQIPEGLKQYSSEIINELKSRLDKIEYFISGNSCWGGCDIAIEEAKQINADLIIHFGHARFIKDLEINKKVIYVDIKDKKEIKKLIKLSIIRLKGYKKIALVSSIQHTHKLKEISEIYLKNNQEVFIPEKKGFSDRAGHVTGCEYSGLKCLVKKESVDCVVVIGNQFHGLGAGLALPEKDVFLIDTYNDKVVKINELRDKIIKQRAVSINKFKEINSVGIILESKIGQRFGNFNKIKELFMRQGKEVFIIIMDEITPEKLFNFYKIQGFVELGCPRIGIDDYEKYLKSELKKPVITFKESLVVLGINKWGDLIKNGFI